jgi:hypothetical protein
VGDNDTIGRERGVATGVAKLANEEKGIWLRGREEIGDAGSAGERGKVEGGGARGLNGLAIGERNSERRSLLGRDDCVRRV